MKISILPKSRLGWWSVGLIAVFIPIIGLQGLYAHDRDTQGSTE